MQCYVWSTLLYGAETWTISKRMEKKINAFEMWVYRRMLRIQWTAHTTNNEVLEMIKPKRRLMTTIKQRKMAYFGHIIRRNGVQKLILDGRHNGKRGRGRPRMQRSDNIEDWIEIGYVELVRKAQDRKEWKSMIVKLLDADGT